MRGTLVIRSESVTRINISDLPDDMQQILQSKLNTELIENPDYPNEDKIFYLFSEEINLNDYLTDCGSDLTWEIDDTYVDTYDSEVFYD